jgi:hypothetical protein
MATTLENASFKVKAGVVDSVDGLVPEKGAIVFDDETGTIKVGDGFNWRPLPLEDFSALALSLAVQIDTPLLAATPIAPFTYFDTVDYQQGTDIVPTIGDTITINANMVADMSSNFQASVSTPNTSVLIESLVNAVVVGSRELNFTRQNQFLTFDWTNRASLVAADVMTLRVSSDNATTLSLRNLAFGLIQIS